jgi:hypothetical protein
MEVTEMKIAVPIIAALAFAIPSFAADNNGAAKAASHNATRTAWAPQTLSGTIAMVDPAHRLVVIQTDGGVPYDLDVSRQTKIENGNQRMSLQNLNQDVNQKVSVKLIPERRGDVAAWIRVGGAS